MSYVILSLIHSGVLLSRVTNCHDISTMTHKIGHKCDVKHILLLRHVHTCISEFPMGQDDTLHLPISLNSIHFSPVLHHFLSGLFISRQPFVF